MCADMTRSVIAMNALTPAARAYALAYAASVGPRLFGYLRTIRRKDLSVNDKINLLATILRTSAQLHRFPFAAGLIIGGATAIPNLLTAVLRSMLKALHRTPQQTITTAFLTRLRFVCTFFSSWLAFSLLNRDKSWPRKRARSRAVEIDASNPGRPNQHVLPPPGYHPSYAGKTIDFTLFAFLRAIDVLAITAWMRSRSSNYHPEKRIRRLASFLKWVIDPWIFSVSSATIMWAWFYSPHRLPRTYNRWISSAADLDPRLLQALRLCRQGDFVYGEETGQAPLLKSLCDERNMPQEWGDPTKTIPIPCELYHCGRGKSCEVHAVSRFLDSFKFAMELYLPIQLLSKLRSPSTKAYMKAVMDASRSSSFLAAFVSLFYYFVCLARTRIGPKLFSRQTVTPQMWDSGLCVLAGCLACGWSILLEKAGRRQEIAFFVAPRACGVLLPRVYDRKFQRREQIVFALSTALVLNAATDERVLVRGILGRLLSGVLKE